MRPQTSGATNGPFLRCELQSGAQEGIPFLLSGFSHAERISRCSVLRMICFATPLYTLATVCDASYIIFKSSLCGCNGLGGDGHDRLPSKIYPSLNSRGSACSSRQMPNKENTLSRGSVALACRRVVVLLITKGELKIASVAGTTQGCISDDGLP